MPVFDPRATLACPVVRLGVQPMRKEGDRVVSRRLFWTPRAKQRPQHTWSGGQHRTFTPKPTRDAEHALAQQWVGPPAEGPIAVEIVMTDTDVWVTISHCPEPSSAKLRRGDIDNYTKLILDALNRVAWCDDRQIAQLSVRKL